MADGLLDFIKTPEGQGLLSTVFGGLAGARRNAPLNSIGQAGMAGLMGYGQAQERQAQLAHEQQAANLRDMQIKQMQQKMQDEADVRTMAGQFFKPGANTEQIFSAPGQAGPTVARAGLQATASQPSFDTNGFVGALFAKNPSLGLQYQQAFAKETPFNKVDPKDYTPESVLRFSQSRNYGDLVPRSKMEFSPGGVAFDPYKVQPGTVMADPNKPFSVGADGKFVPNTPYQNYEINKALAGKTYVNVAGPENQYNKDIGAGLAANGLALVSSAQAAPEVVRNAQLIRKALDNGAITGTGADARYAIEKALSTAGLVGSDRAANTEVLMSGLAKTTLAGVKTSGLGAGNGFTDKDREFLEGAISGTTKMTPENIRRVADLSERVATTNHKKGTQVLQRWQADPALRAVSQDSVIDPLPTIDQTQSVVRVPNGKRSALGGGSWSATQIGGQ